MASVKKVVKVAVIGKWLSVGMFREIVEDFVKEAPNPVTVKTAETIDEIKKRSEDYYNLFIIMNIDNGGKQEAKIMEEIKNLPGPDPMIAVVMSETAQKKGTEANWPEEGVITCVKEPLDKGKLEFIFTKLRIGMFDGKFRKPFEVLVVYEDNQDHENFNQVVEEHITVVKASQVDELGIKSDTETKTKTIYPYDMIFVHKANVAQKFRKKGFTNTIYGVASAEEEHAEFKKLSVESVDTSRMLELLNSVAEELI